METVYSTHSLSLRNGICVCTLCSSLPGVCFPRFNQKKFISTPRINFKQCFIVYFTIRGLTSLLKVSSSSRREKAKKKKLSHYFCVASIILSFVLFFRFKLLMRSAGETKKKKFIQTSSRTLYIQFIVYNASQVLLVAGTIRPRLEWKIVSEFLLKQFPFRGSLFNQKLVSIVIFLYGFFF